MVPRNIVACAAAVLLGACASTARPSDATNANHNVEHNDAGARTACGMISDPTRGCCPASWRDGDLCRADPAAEVCWTECHALQDGPDGGMHVRGTLACGTDGVIVTGQGLYPCTPDQ